MRRIATIALTAAMLALSGCKQPDNYFGTCTIEKVDGRVTTVKIGLPNNHGSTSTTFEVKDRESLDKLIAGLDSLVLDLKIARDQMKVVEPPATQKPAEAK